MLDTEQNENEAAGGRSDSTAELAACEWNNFDEDETWWTSCGEGFNLESGGPSDNGMNYCPYCGKPLVEAANA